MGKSWKDGKFRTLTLELKLYRALFTKLFRLGISEILEDVRNRKGYLLFAFVKCLLYSNDSLLLNDNLKYLNNLHGHVFRAMV